MPFTQSNGQASSVLSWREWIFASLAHSWKYRSDSFVSITRGHKHDPLIQNKRHLLKASYRGAVHSEKDTDFIHPLLLRLFVCVCCACIAAMYLHQQFSTRRFNSRWPPRVKAARVFESCAGNVFDTTKQIQISYPICKWLVSTWNKSQGKLQHLPLSSYLMLSPLLLPFLRNKWERPYRRFHRKSCIFFLLISFHR